MAAARRGNLSDSLNFRLPRSWLTGTVELQVDGVSLDCKEAAGPTINDCSVQVSFNFTDQPEVKFIAVQWTDASGTTHNPTPVNLIQLHRRLVAIFPIANLNRTNGSLTWSGMVPPDLSTLNSQLATMRLWDLCFSPACDRLYYGILRGPDQGGLAFLPGTAGSGTMPTTNFTYGRNRHAHELAHNLDRRHAPFCGASGPTTPPFPFTASIGGTTVATLGPMTLGANDLIFGLDTNTMRVVNPNNNFELMSYCVRSTWRWISKFTYDAVRTAINSTFAYLASPPSADLGEQEDQPYLVVRGTVDFDNDTASFLPFGTLESPVQPPTPEAGDYTLQLLDAVGGLIREVPFKPTEFRADASITGGGEDPGLGLFLIPVRQDPAIKEAVVIHNQARLATAVTSPNPPTVQVIFPNGGELLSGDKAVLAWMGSDPDPGDVVTYLVQISSDGGSTWDTLVTDWPEESYEVDLNVVKGSSNSLLRVMASDGFNTATDVSDAPFSVENSRPAVSILTPIANELFTGSQLIFFEALTLDTEDGELPDSGVEWTSSINGVLGTGVALTMAATDLSEGIHLITATATDSGGLTSTASVTIRVFRSFLANLPPVADAGLDQVFECSSPVGASVTLDGSRSSDPTGDPLMFTWTGSFGTVTGPTPTITLPLGPHTITLTVVDDRGKSDSDVVTVTVEDTVPPVVTAALVPIGDVEDDEGRFRVEFSARDACDPDPAISTATLNGIPMLRGQVVELEIDDETEVELDDGILELEAQSFSLLVASADATENVATATATPQFALDDDDADDDKDKHKRKRKRKRKGKHKGKRKHKDKDKDKNDD